MLEDFITREHAFRAHLLDPKYEVIVHEQVWDDYKTWYIIETYGDGGIRVTIYNDNPGEAIISDLFVSEYILTPVITEGEKREFLETVSGRNFFILRGGKGTVSGTELAEFTGEYKYE